MNTSYIENTLMLGNGFSRAIFEGIPSWKNLFNAERSAIRNYTILYEAYLLEQSKAEDEVKSHIIQGINKALSIENIKKDIYDLDKFGDYLFENNVYNIITTNYDEGIETILCEKCDYERGTEKNLVKEKVYNIRTYKKYINKKSGHEIKLWKIHGDGSKDEHRTESITLGFDQYCGSLSKLSNYIKGKYESAQCPKHLEVPKCKVPMKEKCKNQQFDNLSWAELFFNTNVYIVGLGMDFSEIDIWWMLNKHIRIKNIVPQVQNDIYYLYNELHDKKEERPEIFEALKAFQVECIGIKSDKNYIQAIFDKMNQLPNHYN